MTYTLKFLVILLTIELISFATSTDVVAYRHKCALAVDSVAVSYPRAQNEAGLTYWKEGDYANAVKCFKNAAHHQYSWGQHNLALCYFHGRGVPKNLTEAARLMRLAAAQGNQEAQTTLGMMYQYGLGVEKNYASAENWYQLAAKAGNVTALTSVGYLYQFGLGVPQNSVKACGYYQLAAEKGCVDAMYYLGGLYETGNGVEKNPREALKWYRAAADQGLSEASYRAFRIYYYDLSDSANGYNYLTRAAAQNNVSAMYELAEVYYFGLLSRSIDKQKAFQYYTKAAENGNSTAYMTLKIRKFDD